MKRKKRLQNHTHHRMAVVAEISRANRVSYRTLPIILRSGEYFISIDGAVLPITEIEKASNRAVRLMWPTERSTFAHRRELARELRRRKPN